MDPLLTYFIEQTNDRMHRMESKIDKLLEFKWRIVGGSILGASVISIIVAAVIQVFFSN